jgi:excinuclease ABC subunit A
VDRVINRPGVRARVAQSVQLAVEHGRGLAQACYLTPEAEAASTANASWRDELYSTAHACPRCNISYEELEPRTFSFNSPYGACPICEGLGVVERFDPELVVPDRDRALAGGAIAPWKNLTPGAQRKNERALSAYLEAHRIDASRPLSELTPAVIDQLLEGDDKKFLGILALLEKEYATTTRPGGSHNSRPFAAASFARLAKVRGCAPRR